MGSARAASPLPEPPPPPRAEEAAAPGHPRLVAAALGLLAALAVAAPLPFLGRSTAVAVFYDDAFYYFQIAREMARGAGFTFDGTHATNGFHPLWLMVLAPVFRLLGDAPALHVALVLQAALAAGATAVLFSTLRPRLGGAVAAAAALLLTGQPAAARILGGGMESALVLLLLTLVWSRWLALSETDVVPTRRWLELGVLCALLFLARLEAVMAAPILLLLSRERWRRRPLLAVALAAPTVAAAAAYMAWSRAVVGLWVPVSALVKSYLAPMVWSEQPLGTRVALALDVMWIGSALAHRLMLAAGLDMEWHPAVSAALLVGTVAALLWKRRAVGPALARAGAAFVLIFAVAMLLVDKVGVRLMHDWYRSPTLLLNVVLVAALLPRRTRLARPLVLALVALVLYRVGQRALPSAREPLSAVVEAADRLRALPAGQRIGSWNAGALGYLSDRGVVGLDGLVNDAAFYREVVVPGRIASYLERERIHWLADVTFDDGSLAPLRRYGEAERAAVEAAYTPRAYLRGACARSCLAVALFERTVP